LKGLDAFMIGNDKEMKHQQSNDYKYNHYVPKFYIRNFSGNKKYVDIYDTEQRRPFLREKTKKTFGKDYLYGKDKKIETWFDEQKWADLVGEILTTQRLPKDAGKCKSLLYFLDTSKCRTLKLAKISAEVLKTLDITSLKMMYEHGQLDVPPDIFDNLQVEITKPNLPFLQNTQENISDYMDLSPLLLINNTDIGFISSDNPVLEYNQFFIANSINIGFGTAHIGYQCFIPLSPRVCFCMVDRMPYIYQRDSEARIHIDDKAQIDVMNKLFYYNSHTKIIVPTNMMDYVNHNLAGLEKGPAMPSIYPVTINGSLSFHWVKPDAPYKTEIPFFHLRKECRGLSKPENPSYLVRPSLRSTIEMINHRRSAQND
jgi:hypothetical protein